MSIARGLLRAVLGSALSLALFASAAPAAEKYYMQVKGAKQGEFKGNTTRNGTKWIELTSFSYQVKSPLDSATGKVFGKRQHQPVVVKKTVDSASPQLLQACTTNETLKEVVVQVTRTGPAGKEQLFQTVTLTNAHIPSAKKAGGKVAKNKNEEEEIQFTFQKIMVSDRNGKVTATDDWSK